MRTLLLLSCALLTALTSASVHAGGLDYSKIVRGTYVGTDEISGQDCGISIALAAFTGGSPPFARIGKGTGIRGFLNRIDNRFDLRMIPGPKPESTGGSISEEGSSYFLESAGCYSGEGESCLRIHLRAGRATYYQLIDTSGNPTISCRALNYIVE